MLLENVKLALTGLLANKMRTFLTMLGIIIGIASVIAIMTVGDAMNKSVMGQMGDMGVNNISAYVMQKMTEDFDYSEDAYIREMKDKDYFSEDMINDLSEHFSDRIEGIALKKSAGEIKAEDGKKYANITLEGVNAAAIKQSKIKLIAGRSFSQNEQQEARKVIIVSDRYVNNMLQGDAKAALGKAVEVVIDNKYYDYTIVGVYEYSESSVGGMSAGKNQKDIRTFAYLPLQTALIQMREKQLYDEMEVVAKTGADQGALALDIQQYLNNKYYKDNDTYEAYAYSMKEEIKSMESMLNTQTYAFAAIGAISLLVGGIGVMNIMIVSITERTREIGTRKALGATNGYIRLQFITEAVVVCFIGGILGVIVGQIFGIMASKMMGYSGSASIGGIIFCVLFSMAFGVFFGYYPANKAAKLNPIEALRYE
ncbi:ABC transporter permease [Butyrivibrio sp. WCE2006]|uniref:ABC transporter permease n=1 Tax=Butyrivibrio sp. WCE2006 TaxID=1410611 RepID=UPI0005D233E3|nr:ABC transporter permease [Butyrivibrio sp. WCE2006]